VPVGVRVPPFAWMTTYNCRTCGYSTAELMTTNAAEANASTLNVEVENTRTWARRLTITVPAARVASQRKEVTKRIAQQVRLPGFRKGKVPTDVLEKKYAQAIDQETLEKVVGEAYKEALQQSGFQPISQASVDKLDYQPGSDLTFNVEFEIQPEIELNRLGGFTVQKPTADVTREQIDRVLQRLRQEHAVWQPVEGRFPVNGDLATLEITPIGDTHGQAQLPRKYQVVLGESQAVAGVEEAVRSLKPGEEGDFTLEVHSDSETGVEHDHKAHIKLLEARTPDLPELNDEFAQGLGEFENVAALRERVATDLGSEAEAEAERDVRTRLINHVLDANPFEVPDAMVNSYLERVIKPRKGVPEERIAETRETARPAAYQALKRMLVLDKIATIEGLHAAPSEVDARLEEMSARYGRTAADIRAQLQKSGQLASLAEEITEDKVFGYLKSLSTIE
jgi:trigger factor